MSARLREGYRALVLGATGALGQAFAHALAQDPHAAQVVPVGRAGATIDAGGSWTTSPAWDLKDEASLVALAAALTGPFHLVIDATGALTLEWRGPEKRLADVDAQGPGGQRPVNAHRADAAAGDPSPAGHLERLGVGRQTVGQGGHIRIPTTWLVQ